MRYVSLHNHTSFSFLDSTCNIKPMVARAKEMGYKALAITDHGNLFGAMEFYQECEKNEVKPILGVEAYIVEDIEEKSRSACHTVLLAMNNTGWENIVRLMSWANHPFNEGGGFYYNPRIDLKRLFEHHEGIIVLTACIHGLVNKAIIKDVEEGTKDAERLIGQFQEVFGDRFYLEVQQVNRPGKTYLPEQNTVLREARRLGKQFGIKCVATNDVHYIQKEDRLTHEILKAVASKQTLSTPPKTDTNPRGRIVFSGYDYYMQTDVEMLERFTEEEVHISEEIADRCNVKIEFKPASFMPRYSSELSDDEVYELMVDTCRKNVMRDRLFSKYDTAYVDRIKKEFADIKDAGLQHYFMIVHDICKHADSLGIARGYGRGSAGGSLVSYCLGITKVDPVHYGLFWERFYNRGRKGSMPDIDLDFCVERREEMIAYLREQFGDDRIYPMATISTLAGKAALKDVGRTLGMDFHYLNRITKKFPDKLQNPDKNKGQIILDAIEHVEYVKNLSEGIDEDVEKWNKVLEEEQLTPAQKELLERKIAERKTQLKMLFLHAMKLEGCKRQRSGHACAILMSDRSIDGIVPLSYDTRNKKLLTGWDMYTLEGLGYLKLDILGVKSVTVIDKIRKEIKRLKKPHSPSESETWDDPSVYSAISAGRTVGIFQLDAYLGQSWCQKVKPRNIEEWADVIALIRPAVLEAKMADQYVKAKDSGSIECVHDDLYDVFKPTQGVMLYQEQMIRMVQIMANFSLERSDVLRAAVGKKKLDKMKSLKPEFVEGCKAHGCDETMVENLWALIEVGAGYGFNKSHSVAYAFLGYAMAYYKFHFPVEYYKVMLDMAQNEQKPHEEIAKLYYDAMMHGVEILPPNVDLCNFEFEIHDGKIYYGFKHIKSIGRTAMKHIKKLKGVKSEDDLRNRIISNRITKGVLLPLVYAGVFDSIIDPATSDRLLMIQDLEIFFSLTDKRKMAVLDIMDAKKICYRQALFGWLNENDGKIRNAQLVDSILNQEMMPPAGTEHIPAMSQYEKEYLGIYMNYCDADRYPIGEGDIQKLGDIMRFNRRKHQYRTIVCIDEPKAIVSKKGNKLVLGEIFDTTGKATLMLFGDEYCTFKKTVLENRVLILTGEVSGGTFIVRNCQVPKL